MIVSHQSVRRAVIAAMSRHPADDVDAAIARAAEQLALPIEAVTSVIDAWNEEDEQCSP